MRPIKFIDRRWYIPQFADIDIYSFSSRADKFEELVNNPVMVMRRLSDHVWLSIPWIEDMKDDYYAWCSLDRFLT